MILKSVFHNNQNIKFISMKKVAIAFVAALAVFSTSQAQLKPEAGSVGLGFRVTGLANVAFSNWMSSGLSGNSIPDPMNLSGDGSADGLTAITIPQEMFFGRYYLSSDLAIRFGLGINSMSTAREMSDSNIIQIGDTEIETSLDEAKGFSFAISAGIEKHFASAASRLDPYAGAQINFASLGSMTMEGSTTDATDPASSTSYSYVIAGGSHFSINLLAGFNYFFSDNFAIGAEMMWGFGSTSTGGDWSFDGSATGGNPSVTTTTTNGGSSTWKRSGFGVGSTAGVNASIFW